MPLRALLVDAGVAWRNVLRQPRRSALGAMAVLFGAAALIVAGGFIEWIFWAMREGTIHGGLGHLQVVRTGYLERGAADPFGFILPADAPEKELIEALPQVRTVSPRLKLTGLLGYKDASLSFLGEGRDPQREPDHEEGVIVEAGAALSHAAPARVVLGRGLAQNLGAKVGDAVVVLVNKRGGTLDGIELTVGGIFSTQVKAYDDVALHMTLDTAEELLQAGGAHAWVVYLHDTKQTSEVVRVLQETLDSQYQVVPWYEAADFYQKTVRLFSRQVLVMKLIIALVVILSISNTMMMTVMERVNEIATAMALGLRRARVLSRFVLEGLLVGCAGAIAGCALGWLAGSAISAVGIPMPPPPGMARGYVGQVLVHWGLMWDAVLVAAGAALVASFYPAWRASRMVIADALRQGR